MPYAEQQPLLSLVRDDPGAGRIEIVHRCIGEIDRPIAIVLAPQRPDQLEPDAPEQVRAEAFRFAHLVALLPAGHEGALTLLRKKL